MGKSIRHTSNDNDVDLSDQVAQTLGMAPKPAAPDGGGKKSQAKQKPVETSDAVAQALGIKKKVGGDETFPTQLESQSPEQAAKAYDERNLTSQSVDVLANTDAGKKMGLNNLSPEAKEMFAHAHNGQKPADLTNAVSGIIDNFYPKTADPKLNQKRFEIKQAVLSGNQDAIVGLKNNIDQSIQQQITQREKEVLSGMGTDYSAAYPGYRDLSRITENDPKIQQLRAQHKQSEDAIIEYGKMSLVNSKEMQPWLKLEAEHPFATQMTPASSPGIRSQAAYFLGQMVKERYGIPNETPNSSYNTEAEGYRLIMKNLQLSINESLDYGIPIKNAELLKKAQDKLALLAKYKDVYSKLDTEDHPDVGLDKTARFLGDIIAELHPNKLVRTKEDVVEAGKIADQRNPGFMDKYGRFVQIAAQKQDETTFIPRGGGLLNEFIGGVASSATKEAIDLLKWNARGMGDERETRNLHGMESSAELRGTTQSNTEPTKIVYDKEGKVYREMPNENYSTLPFNNFFRFAGESLPGLLEFVASEGVGKGLSKIATLGKIGKAGSEFSGLAAATYLTSYNSNREFADANIDDNSDAGEAKKIILANFLTMANAGVFHALGASPSKLVERAISKSVAPDVMKVFEENNWEQLSQKTAKSFLQDKILPRAKAIVQKFGETLQTAPKIGAVSVIDQKMHDLAGVMTNTNYKPSSVEDNARALVSNTLLMTMVGGIAGMISTGEVPHATKEALHQAGLYAPQYIDQINERVKNGELDPHKANGMVAMIKTMSEELGKASQMTTDDGTPLTVGQQRDVAIANFRKRAADQLEQGGIPVGSEKVASEADKDIKNIRAQNNWLNIVETPTFKSVKEVDENGKIGGKVAAMEDIDPTKQYTYDKEGQQVVTDGAALITHLETGDIYEKEKPDDQKEPTEKTTDTKGKNKEPAPDQKEAPVEGSPEYKKNIRDDYFAKADFFTPEEKEKFSTLDEAGQDKMIDDKRAELNEGKSDTLAKGKEAINNAADAGKLGLMSDQAKENPEQFLKYVADQAFGRDENGQISNLPNAEQAVREQYGNDIVDAAKELYPEEKTAEPPVDNSKQIETLQGSYDRLIASGVDPDDSDMRSLKSKIDDLSSPKNQTDGNVQTKQSGGSQKEGDAEESGQKGQQKTDEKGDVLNPESGQGAGEPPAGKPAPASDESKSPIVGIRDSIVNADRVHKGLEPLLKEFTRKWQDNWNQIKANIRKGFSPRKYIEDTAQRIIKEDNDKSKGIKSKHRTTFSDYDYATLLFDRLDIQNNIAIAKDMLEEAKSKEGDSANPVVSSMGQQTAAQQLLDHYNQQLIQNDTVGRRMKSESGRALSAIQMMAQMDGELVNWTRDLENLYHGTMPEVLKGFVERIQNEYKAKTEELRQHYETQLQKAAEDAYKKAKEESKKSTSATRVNNPKGVANKLRAAADNIRKSNFGKADLPEGTQKMGVSFDLNEGIAKVLEAVATALEKGKEFAKELKDALEKYLPEGHDENEFRGSVTKLLAENGVEEKYFNPEFQRNKLKEDIKSIAKENDATTIVPDVVKSVRQLMTSYVKDGVVNSLDELVKKTHEDLKETLPDVTEKDLRDTFSGYGMKAETEGKVKSDLAKLKEQARKVSQYQELLKKPVGETLSQEHKRLEKANVLHEEVQGYMREMGIEEQPPSTTTEGKKAVALDKAKARMKGIISSLDKQISAGERKQRNGVTPDTELTVLRSERTRLSAQLDEIEKSKITPEQKIKQTEDALNRQILNYERQIREGVDPLRPREDRPNTKQIDQLRKRKNELKKEVEGIRRDTNPNYSPQQRALDDYNEGLQKQIFDKENRLESGDLEKEEPTPKIDFSRDPKSLTLESRLRKLEHDFYAARRAGELINRSWLQKAMSLAATVKRAFVLSRISTFGRLIAADFWSNGVFEPAESVAGLAQYAGTKVGFAKKLSQQADRYGVSTWGDVKALIKGELGAVKSLVNLQTWKDFVSDEKNGYSELSLMYEDPQHITIPKELRDHWQNIEHGLESISRSHGAVKGLSKRMEFTRSYIIRKEAARRKGTVDVDNPVIQASMGAMAYHDAMNHVLMGDNMASRGYEWVMNKLESKGIGGAFAALAMKELMPIVKIPTNLLLNAVRATVGTPLAGGMIVARGIAEVMSKGNSEWGISKLTPEQSDALLRNLRKGNVGMGLMLAGFFAPNMFGAAHYYQKGSDQPEGMEEGDVNFFGVKVPKWLADNPYLVTMKIGASLRASFNYYTDEKDQGFAEAATRSLLHTAAGAAQETPLIGSPAELYQAATGSGGNWFWYNLVKSTLEPGILQEIAEDNDVKDGWFSVYQGDRIKRKTKSVGDALKSGIPGLREQLDQK